MKKLLLLLIILLTVPSFVMAASSTSVTYDTHGATNVPSQTAYDTFVSKYTNFYYAKWGSDLLIYGSVGTLSFDGADLTSTSGSVYALYPDGSSSSQSYYNIQNANTKGVHSVVPPDTTKPVVNVSLAEGSYTTKQQIILSINETGTIYYSLDGSVPSLVYSNPIMIDKTMTVKYYGKDVAGNKSDTVSVVYTMLDRDGDLILDGEDVYPDDSTNTPPSDRDGDGVQDSLDLYPDDATNTPPAYDETSEAEANKMQRSILIVLVGLVLTSLVMGVRIL